MSKLNFETLNWVEPSTLAKERRKELLTKDILKKLKAVFWLLLFCVFLFFMLLVVSYSSGFKGETFAFYISFSFFFLVFFMSINLTGKSCRISISCSGVNVDSIFFPYSAIKFYRIQKASHADCFKISFETKTGFFSIYTTENISISKVEKLLSKKIIGREG